MFRKHIRSNWNTDLKDSHAFSKECYRIWVAAGKPLDPNHPLKCAYKEAKQAFRRRFRALRMSETENFYLSVDISNPAIFRLIRSKLAQQKTPTKSLMVNGSLYHDSALPDAWASYFESLYCPDWSQYDQSHMVSVNRDL